MSKQHLQVVAHGRERRARLFHSPHRSFWNGDVVSYTRARSRHQIHFRVKVYDGEVHTLRGLYPTTSDKLEPLQVYYLQEINGVEDLTASVVLSATILDSPGEIIPVLGHLRLFQGCWVCGPHSDNRSETAKYFYNIC